MSEIDFNKANRDAWVANVAKHLPVGTRVIDIGAGTCPYRVLFSHCDYKTQDFGQYTGTQGANWDYIGDASSIPVENGAFDAVLCTEVLEHVPEPIRIIQEASRILKTGGKFFISAPLGSGLHQEPYHFYGGFTPHFYTRFLSLAGFDIVSIESNGKFFRLLMQEIRRAVVILQKKHHYPRWHPARWILRIAGTVYVAEWLSRLDDDLPVNEFTVGYHVEAVKVRKYP